MLAHKDLNIYAKHNGNISIIYGLVTIKLLREQLYCL
jgi:hypothetical protein